MKSPGGGPCLESGWEPDGSGIRVLPLPPCRVSSPGGGLRFENVWPARGGGGRDLRSLLLEGAPPARHRALKARAGSYPGNRHLHLPLATTQLVEGACLIRRYCAVRSRGGQLWRDSSVGQSARLMIGRSSVRC